MSTLSWSSRAAQSLVAVLVGLAAGACLYDPSQRCGPAMTYVADAHICVCDSDAIAVPGGCQRCAADEVVTGGACVCPAGQTKSADQVCVTVAGLDDPCDAAGAPCTDATYSYCAIKAGATAGTCTKGCGDNADCDAAYTCATWEDPPYCRTFTGVGQMCDEQADCVGDAGFCETFQSSVCLIAQCSLTEDHCPRNSECCDFSGYGLPNLCIPGGCP